MECTQRAQNGAKFGVRQEVRTFQAPSDVPGSVHVNGDWNGIETLNGGFWAIEDSVGEFENGLSGG